MNSNTSDLSLPPSAPPVDAFMSDSPRQQQQTTSSSSMNVHLDGLHHRSSRRSNNTSSADPSQQTTFTNKTAAASAARPTTRLFHSYNNPYHGNTTNTTTHNTHRQGVVGSNNSSSRGAADVVTRTLSLARVIQFLSFIVFIGYFTLLFYTSHSLWSSVDNDVDSAAMNTQGGAMTNNAFFQLGGVRRSTNRDIYEEQSSQHHQYQYQYQYSDGGVEDHTNIIDGAGDTNNDDDDDAAAAAAAPTNKNADSTSSFNGVKQQQQQQRKKDYRIVSLHDFSRRRRRMKKRKPRSSDNDDDDNNESQAPPDIPFVFDPSSRQYHHHSTEQDDTVVPSSTTSFEQQYLDNMAKHKYGQYERRQRQQHRKRRTTPPPSSTQQQQQQLDDDAQLPIWYNLDHASYDTVLTNQKRWEDDNNNNNNNNDDNTASSSSSSLLDTNYNLCGKHAQQASSFHPQNYFPPLSSSSTSTSSFPQQQQQRHHHQSLNSQSKVLITGILSPLGFHLTLALHRQCNITNFIGIDSQMPNDPLSRLEMQDRLEVLLDELSPSNTDGSKKESSSDSFISGKSLWYVPFLGLELKHPKNEPQSKFEERERRQRQLVKIRSNPHHYIIDNTNTNNEEEGGGISSLLNTRPNERYGIPPSPGVNEDGYGTLDIIAEHRPTHIVHLAGTQSDSLLNSKRLKKGEEEEDGESSISSRPHLYELRMGMVGMEQLLSSVVAQTMIPSPSSETSLATATAAVPPHVVYASSYDARYFSETSKRLNSQKQQQHHSIHHHRNKEIMLGEEQKHRSHHSPPRGFHGVSHLIDEILAVTYHGLHGVSTIGLRFDAIYGPRGFGAPSTSVPILNMNRMRKNVGVSPDVALAEAEVRRLYRKWMKMIKDKEEDLEGNEKGEEEGDELSLIEESGWAHAPHHPRDFVFVEDAVGAIMAAMQYRAVQGSPTTFNIGSGEMNTLSAFADKIQQVAFDDKRPKSPSKSVIDVERSNAARSASYTSSEYLGWTAKTALKDGVAKLLAWHLDRALPFFPPSTLSHEEVDYSGDEGGVKHMDGKELLSKNNVESCSDVTCLLEKHNSYPCASECSTMTCTSSIFDSVLPLIHDATDGCYLVLYTASLGYDVESLNVETEYSDSESTFEYHEGTVCTIAFVPSESTLVKNVIANLPDNALATLDVSPNDKHSVKLKKLNGHLAHKGWLLIFVDDATHPLPPEELLLPKLAPARLFHSSVRRAMYADKVTPYLEDALFLATESYRGVTKSRNIMGPDKKGRKTKYRLPEEPQRYAVMVASQMRDTPTEEGQKMSLRDVTRSMMKENGLDADNHELKEVKAQRECYERSRSPINSMTLRSSDPAYSHKFEIKDFIRSQWVLYNLSLEGGHHLRCEWYREHSRWAGSTTLDSGLDQLSFAYVMAKRDLSRKIITEQPLPKELSLMDKVINAATDAHEWHPIFLGDGSAIPLDQTLITSKAEAIPLNIADRPEFQLEKVQPDTVSEDKKSSYYVRIMSDDVMMKARKQWATFVASFETD